MTKYIGRFEKYIHENFKNNGQFAKFIDASPSAISKWVRGVAFPSPQHIRAIWNLTRDEIGPMYWYSEWPTDVRLRNESIKLLRSEKNT